MSANPKDYTSSDTVEDAAAAPEAFGLVEAEAFPRLEKVYADQKYHRYALYAWTEENVDDELVIVRRPGDQAGFRVLPQRRVVERTLAWLGRCRRLSKDYERSTDVSETMIKVSMLHGMLKRLAPADNAFPEFHYRDAA